MYARESRTCGLEIAPRRSHDGMDAMRLELTPGARDHLIRTRTDRKISERAGARLSYRDGRVGLTFATSPVSTDTVMSADGIDVYIARELADKLSGARIDTRQEHEREVLVFFRGAT